MEDKIPAPEAFAALYTKYIQSADVQAALDRLGRSTRNSTHDAQIDENTVKINTNAAYRGVAFDYLKYVLHNVLQGDLKILDTSLLSLLLPWFDMLQERASDSRVVADIPLSQALAAGNLGSHSDQHVYEGIIRGPVTSPYAEHVRNLTYKQILHRWNTKWIGILIPNTSSWTDPIERLQLEEIYNNFTYQGIDLQNIKEKLELDSDLFRLHFQDVKSQKSTIFYLPKDRFERQDADNIGRAIQPLLQRLPEAEGGAAMQMRELIISYVIKKTMPHSTKPLTCVGRIVTNPDQTKFTIKVHLYSPSDRWWSMEPTSIEFLASDVDAYTSIPPLPDNYYAQTSIHRSEWRGSVKKAIALAEFFLHAVFGKMLSLEHDASLLFRTVCAQYLSKRGLSENAGPKAYTGPNLLKTTQVTTEDGEEGQRIEVTRRGRSQPPSTAFGDNGPEFILNSSSPDLFRRVLNTADNYISREPQDTVQMIEQVSLAIDNLNFRLEEQDEDEIAEIPCNCSLAEEEYIKHMCQFCRKSKLHRYLVREGIVFSCTDCLEEEALQEEAASRAKKIQKTGKPPPSSGTTRK